MKKILVVLVMCAIIVVYYLSVKNVGESKNKQENIVSQIEILKTELQENYPEDARGVIEKNNELMILGYNKKMVDEGINTYVEALRMLYANKLNEVNSLETQTQKLIEERKKNGDKPLIISKSEILDVVITKEKEDQSETAEISVLHHTNRAKIKRTYYLVQEDGKWKIHSWENQTDNKAKES